MHNASHLVQHQTGGKQARAGLTAGPAMQAGAEKEAPPPPAPAQALRGVLQAQVGGGG